MATPIPSNRCAFALGEAADACIGQLRGGDRAALASSVSIDTRTIAPGAIFVALRGEASDGHAWLARAAELGASAAIVETGRAIAAIPCIEVDDTVDALGRLAHHHLERIRAAHGTKIIAVGGAAGKTTTKELTAAAARAIFGPTLASPGNLNNLIGVPMTAFMLTAEHRAAVIECGTNRRGEIARLARIVEPDVAMVLNVDIEHSEGLGGLDEIADEEAALFSTARRFAVASTEESLVIARIPARIPTVNFGLAEDADVRLASRTALDDGRSRVSFKLNPRLVKPGESPILITEIALLGRAAAINCAAAVAAVVAASTEAMTGAQLDAIGAALASQHPVARRLAPSMIGDLLVIDDSYNAQPASMRVALDTAREIADGRRARLVVALGDMLELGALATESHDQVVHAAIDAHPAVILVVGPQMRAAIERVDSAALRDLRCVVASDSSEAASIIGGLTERGDVVLVKGSFGMAMDCVIAGLRRS